jgi:hypothetical protein
MHLPEPDGTSMLPRLFASGIAKKGIHHENNRQISRLLD